MLSCSVWKTCGVDHVRTSSKLVSSVGIGTIGYINTILKGLLAFAVNLAEHILRDLIEAHLSDIYCSRGWSCHLTYLTTALRGIQASLPRRIYGFNTKNGTLVTKRCGGWVASIVGGQASGYSSSILKQI